MFKKKRDQPLPTLLDGKLLTFESSQIFRIGGGAVRYNLSFVSDRDDVELKILVPLVVQVEKHGKSLGIINLGTIKLADLRKIFQDKILKAWGTTRICPQTMRIPLQQITVKDVKFNVVLKAKKEVKT